MRTVTVRVEGDDAIERIELVRSGRVIERHFPDDHILGPLSLPSRVKCRLRYGWGPWGALDLDRVCAWDLRLQVTHGRIRGATGYFQSAPFGEALRDVLEQTSATELRLRSSTTRRQCYGEDPTKALVVDLEGDARTVLSWTLESPVKTSLEVSLGDLIDDNAVLFTGGFTTESLIVERLVAPAEFGATVSWTDVAREERRGDWYLVRVQQHNGHMAWSSPVWVG